MIKEEVINKVKSYKEKENKNDNLKTNMDRAH